MAKNVCIEFRDAVAGYKDFMTLNNLSFKVRKGSITLLLGPNGAGKSTVLKTLFGLHKPASDLLADPNIERLFLGGGHAAPAKVL